jgi:FlaA1/EpsC-like NDP-sugar epimerase
MVSNFITNGGGFCWTGLGIVMFSVFNQYVKRLSQHGRRLIRPVVLDLLVVFFAYTGAYSTRALISPLDYFADSPYILLATVATIPFLYIFGVYNRIWSQTSGHGISIIIGAVSYSLIVMMAVAFLVEPRWLPISVIVLGNVLALGGLVAVRYRSRLISGILWRWRVIWHNDFPEVGERVLIIGAGESGQTVALRLKHHFNGHHYSVIGFIDDDPEKQHMYVENSPILGTCHDIVRVVTESKIDLIVIAMHNISGQDFRAILSYCEHTAARIKIVPDMLGLLNAKRSGAFLRDVQPEDIIGRSVISRHEAVDLSSVIGKVVLVTGAAGSIGSELSAQLVSYEPVALILLDNNESALHDLMLELQTKHPDVNLVPILADITVAESLALVFAQYRPHIIFHAAAYKHVPMLELHPREAIRVNVNGTRCLMELARNHHAERFVLISTDKAVKPSSVMGASKRLCELMVHTFCRQDNCPTLFTAVRFGNVLGSRGSVVPIFNHQIDNGGPITVTHPEMTRYFMSIPEAANLVIHAACLTNGDDIFVLQMGEVVRILDIAERMVRLRGLRPYKDIGIEFVGMRPGEKMHEELYDESEQSEPTVHPYIIKLDGWENTMPPHIFLEKLDDVCVRGLNGGVDIIKEVAKLTTFPSVL